MADEKKMLNTKEAAQFLGLAEQTLHNYRFNRRPPNYVKIGRRIVYERAELERYIELHRVILSE